MIPQWIRSLVGRSIHVKGHSVDDGPEISATPDQFVELIKSLDGFAAYPVGVELMQTFNQLGYVSPPHRLALEVAVKQFDKKLTRLAIDTYRFESGDVLYFEHGRWCYTPQEYTLDRKPIVQPLEDFTLDGVKLT